MSRLTTPRTPISNTAAPQTVSEVPQGSRTERLKAAWRDGGATLIARRGRQVILRKLHEGLLERFLGGREHQPTNGTASLGDLTIASKNKLSGSFYDPTPRLVIRWILDALGYDKGNWNFVDIGTGRGRVVLEAARHPFRRVIGVEFAEELCAAAEENVAMLSLGEIQAGRVGVVHADATEWVPPSGPTVFFLYNPFDAHVMKRFLNQMLADHDRNPRPMIFLYLNPDEEKVFESEPRLERTPLADGLATRLAMLSPYDLSIYATPSAINAS